jgi:hypothetical protein
LFRGSLIVYDGVLGRKSITKNITFCLSSFPPVFCWFRRWALFTDVFYPYLRSIQELTWWQKWHKRRLSRWGHTSRDFALPRKGIRWRSLTLQRLFQKRTIHKRRPPCSPKGSSDRALATIWDLTDPILARTSMRWKQSELIRWLITFYFLNQ